MACVCCFFDNEFQKELKKNSFTKSNFYNNLQKYKADFTSAFCGLVDVDKCCKPDLQNKYPALWGFYNDIYDDLKSKIQLIENIFDEIILIYSGIISNLQNVNMLIENFIKTYCTNYNSDNAMSFAGLLFRAREKGRYNIKEIREYFHIPFSVGGNISAQRFSKQGTPMLYFGNSLLTTKRELNKEVSQLNFSLFFPNYSEYYSRGIYSFANYFENTINFIVPKLTSYNDLIIQYDNDTYTFAKKNMNKILADTILYQVLTFPVEDQFGKKEEYFLPQCFAEYYYNKNYAGIAYQSTKQLTELSIGDRENGLDYNYCFFVKQANYIEYNEALLKTFHTVCIGECRNIHYNKVIEYLKKVERKLIKVNKKYNASDYGLLVAKVRIYIENRCIETRSNEDDYQIELMLLYKLLKKTMKVIRHPGRNKILKNHF